MKRKRKNGRVMATGGRADDQGEAAVMDRGLMRMPMCVLSIAEQLESQRC